MIAQHYVNHGYIIVERYIYLVDNVLVRSARTDLQNGRPEWRSVQKSNTSIS